MLAELNYITIKHPYAQAIEVHIPLTSVNYLQKRIDKPRTAFFLTELNPL